MSSKNSQPGWLAALSDWFIADPRELAVFAFIAKTLARSREHRLYAGETSAFVLRIIFQALGNRCCRFLFSSQLK